jgi:endonuclease YncB( thermonuclease family)
MGSLYKAILFAVATFAALAFSSSTLAAPASKEDRTGVVTYVVDGDTVRVRMPSGAKPVSVRIYGIDAPEICSQAERQPATHSNAG